MFTVPGGFASAGRPRRAGQPKTAGRRAATAG